jgi:hypothetical protein
VKPVKRIEVFKVTSVMESKTEGTLSVNGVALFVIRSDERIFVGEEAESPGFDINSIMIHDQAVKAATLFQECTITLKCKDSFNIQELKENLYGPAAKDYAPSITLDQGKQIAEKAAYENLNSFAIDKMGDFLSSRYEEADCCWFFLLSPEIGFESRLLNVVS